MHGSEFVDGNLETHPSIDKSESNCEEEPSRFAFTKPQVGKSLYDRKDLNFLATIGRLEGLSLVLQLDLSKGLSPDEDVIDVPLTLEGVWKAVSTSTRPEIPRHEIPLPQSTRFRDRRRVYGENRIPVRPQKSILELMWIALHDKVLVYLQPRFR